MSRAVSCVISAFNKNCIHCQIVAGAFTGGIAGGIAGWVSNTGILRGVAMVAIAGATISVQFLDALRTYWCSECPGSSSSSSMVSMFILSCMCFLSSHSC